MSNLDDLLAQYLTRADAARALCATPGIADMLTERELARHGAYAEDVTELVQLVRAQARRAARLDGIVRDLSMNPKGHTDGSERTTGRTTRMLLRGLAALSEGHRVLIIASTHECAKSLAARLSACASYMRIQVVELGIEYGGPRAERTGFRGVTLVDHSALEM